MLKMGDTTSEAALDLADETRRLEALLAEKVQQREDLLEANHMLNGLRLLYRDYVGEFWWFQISQASKLLVH
jgi:hypothetical protein